MKITPVGNKLLILPRTSETKTTDSGFEIPDAVLSEGVVVEVSEFLSPIYKQGDVVLYPDKSGTAQVYNGKLHHFINGQEYPSGDVWAIITEQ